MKKSRVIKMATRSKSKNKCMCNPGYVILAIIFFTLGLFSLVNGFIAHWNGLNYQMPLGWYFIGFILLAIGKMAKWKAFCGCVVHN